MKIVICAFLTMATVDAMDLDTYTLCTIAPQRNVYQNTLKATIRELDGLSSANASQRDDALKALLTLRESTDETALFPNHALLQGLATVYAASARAQQDVRAILKTALQERDNKPHLELTALRRHTQPPKQMHYDPTRDLYYFRNDTE